MSGAVAAKASSVRLDGTVVRPVSVAVGAASLALSVLVGACHLHTETSVLGYLQVASTIARRNWVVDSTVPQPFPGSYLRNASGSACNAVSARCADTPSSHASFPWKEAMSHPAARHMPAV